MKASDVTHTGGAVFSDCRRYRYRLWREWGDLFLDYGKTVMFIGLNPSTADETIDDPTMRRCIRYTKDWGANKFLMANLFGLRSTDPKELHRCKHDPVGPENNEHILDMADGADIIVAAWGVHGGYMHRDKWAIANIPGYLVCLGITKDGFPRHPLYCRADAELVSYRGEHAVSTRNP